jgi:hypothetical protein
MGLWERRKLTCIMCRLLRRENRECGRVPTMAEGPTSIQQEKADLCLNEVMEENCANMNMESYSSASKGILLSV